MAAPFSVPLAISTNGQYVLFESRATNLIAGASTGGTVADIYIRDVISKTTTLVTVATNGSQANGSSSASMMTPDGRYVVFSSEASNLVANDTNALLDVFVRDVQSGITKVASAGAGGAVRPFGTYFSLGQGQESDSPAITPDGRYVCFMSTATNLVPGLTNFGEIYVRDFGNNSTVCVSSNAHQFVAHNLICFDNKISDDGQFVTFQAITSNTGTNSYVLRHRVQTGTDDLIASNGVSPGNYVNATMLNSTPDGRFVAFIGSTNGGSGIFVWDAQSSFTVLASVAMDGTAPTNANCDFPELSSDGRFVLFMCNATNLTARQWEPTTMYTAAIFRREPQSWLTLAPTGVLLPEKLCWAIVP
jgi:Tol biopolymer transport system component